MAVEYDISSDVAVIKETGSVSQCARVTQMYSGQITYDDEAGSKFATATINGKSQRVMLCVAVNGTVTYDDVPSLYSTVDGHRCLNIVTPTETGTPDDVPSLYETVVIDGQNVRAVRCIMINKTPVYDGVSSTCTFTGDDGKTHTAQLVNKITGGSVQVIIKGTSPLNLPDAVVNSLSYVKAFGGTEQGGVPQGYTQLANITNAGGGYLDTGIIADVDDMEFDVVVKINDSANISWYVLQSRLNSSAPIYGISGSATGNTFIGAFSGARVGAGSTIVRRNGHTYHVNSKCQNGTITLTVEDLTDSTSTTNTGTYTFVAGTTNIGLFGNLNGGNMPSGNTSVISAYIKKGGVKVLDYVPALNPSNVVGFYDKATGTFKVSTAGAFVADQTIVPTPTAPIDIVCNNGVLKYTPNLLDMATENIVLGKYINNSGAVTDSSLNFYNSKYIPVVAGGTYTWSTSSSISYFSVMEYGSDYAFKKRTLFSNAGTSGSITLRSDTAFVLIGSNMDSTDVTLDKIAAVDWQFEKGSSATAYTPYSPTGIYADGTVETINVHGKNLFDKSSYEEITAYVNANTGALTQGTTQKCAVIPCEPNTTYIIANRTTSAWGSFADKTIGSVATAFVTTDNILTTGANDRYLIGLVRTTDGTYDYRDTLNVSVYGGTATAEMLLKVGDYQDEQEILSGVVTRNVGVKVLDGTESWASVDQYSRTYIQITDMVAPNSPRVIPAYCNYFENLHNNEPISSVTAGQFYLAPTKSIYFHISQATTSDFKTWLADQYAAGTPVIVVYPLATPTTESVTGQTLQVTDGDNVLEITQASLDGLELEAQYNAAVSLTIQEVQDANLDNNVTVTIQ